MLLLAYLLVPIYFQTSLMALVMENNSEVCLKALNSAQADVTKSSPIRLLCDQLQNLEL